MTKRMPTSRARAWARVADSLRAQLALQQSTIQEQAANLTGLNQGEEENGIGNNPIARWTM